MPKWAILELLDRIMKTGMKQAQADIVRSFQNHSLLRQNDPLIDKKSANSEKYRP